MVRTVDLTGEIFGRLRVIRRATNIEGKSGRWECLCSCGKTVYVGTSNLRQGNTKSCGCYKKEVTQARAKTHGMCKSKEYRHWAAVKTRCTNPNTEDYKYYSLMEHSQELLDEFVNFYEEIGPIPDTEQKWSVGRKNNLIGYVKGNIEWQLDSTQARNHCLQSNNTSGVAGVIRDRQNGWVARWTNCEGKRKQKWFSAKLLGEEKAFEMACEYRRQMIASLNEQGAGYAETHGAKRTEVSNG